MIKRIKKIVNGEDGVTLVISVVLLAAVTFVSFSLSALIIREIVAARLVLKSEPALSAANSGGEVGLYRLQRGAGALDEANVSLEQSPATYDLASDLYDNPYLLTSVNVACGATTEFWIPLYDPANWENKSANYGSVTVSNAGQCPIEFRVFSWSDTDNNVCPSVNMGVGGPSRTCSSLSGVLTVGGIDDRYILAILPGGSLGQNVQVSITAMENDLVTSRGVPSETPILRITGKSGEVQRKIQIEIRP